MSSPTHHRWQATAGEQINPHIFRRYLTADSVTVAKFELAKGGVVPMHSHPNEQITCVISGRLEFQFGERAVVVGPNEVMQIPGGVPHRVTVFEDAVAIDIFSPIRQDWIDGTDTYFKR